MEVPEENLEKIDEEQYFIEFGVEVKTKHILEAKEIEKYYEVREFSSEKKQEFKFKFK